MLIVGATVYGVGVVLLSVVVILYWKHPSFKNEGFALVLLFDLVFAYRLYSYLKMIRMSRSGQKYGVSPLSWFPCRVTSSYRP